MLGSQGLCVTEPDFFETLAGKKSSCTNPISGEILVYELGEKPLNQSEFKML